MTVLDLPRAGRAPRDRVLALMCAVSGLGAFVGAVAPMTPQAPVRLNAAMACAAAVLLVLALTRPMRWLGHVAVVAHVVGIGVLMVAAATPVGAVASAVTLTWPAVYSAFFLGRAATRACVALVAVTLGTALALDPFVGAAHVAFLVIMTTAAAAEGIAALVDRLESMALTDPLTGLLNREGLRRRGEDALSRAARAGKDATVVVLDLDGFKDVNDRSGHAAGDRVLVDLARSWRSTLRSDDVLARTGGDEFVLVLPDTDRASAHALLHRLAHDAPARWSAGVAQAADGLGLDQLVDRADRDLYAVKSARAVLVPGQRRTGIPL